MSARTGLRAGVHADDDEGGVCGTCHPPADGTHDREVVDRFRDFLEAAGPVVTAADIEEGRFHLRSPANRYHVRFMAWRVGQVDR